MKRKLPIIIVLLLSLIPLLDLLHPGLPLTHDGQDHVARIANFYLDLSHGIIVPRWAANLNWGYGHPILMFLYPLPSYIASLFHVIGFSLVDSTKLVFGLAYIASGLTMYTWVREEFGIEEGIFASVLYLFAPYRFVELYVRGDIGEHLAFVFMPLVLYFLKKVSEKGNTVFEIGGAVSITLLVLAHNAITVMFLPIFFFYALYLFYNTKNRKQFLFSACFQLLIGFCLAGFFVIPAFFEGKYTLRDIVTVHGEYRDSFSTFGRFLYSPWSFGGTGLLSVQFGIVQWLVILGSIVTAYFVRKRKNNRIWFFVGGIVLLIGSLFLMMKESQVIWDHVSLLQKFQFPWRFLAIIVLLAAALGGWLIFHVPKKYKTLVVSILIVIAVISNSGYWHAKAFLQKPESFFTGIYNGTTDTGESAPIWSVRFMEHRPKAPLEVIDGTAKVQLTKRLPNEHDYTVIASTSSRLRENTLYFPGWHVLTDDAETVLVYQDPANRGLMTFQVPSGRHQIHVVFKETKLRLLSDVLSIMTFIGLCIYAILKILWPRFR